MKRNYYYLVAGLQDVVLEMNKLLLNQYDFRELLKTHLHPSDYRLAEKLYLPYDNKNLLNRLQKSDQPFDELGNFNMEQLDDNIRESNSLPEYMARFIESFRNKEPLFPDMSPENELTTLFYQAMLEHDNKFLREWFTFDLTVKNLLTAMISRKYNLPYEHQIIGTDEISETIRKSNARDYGVGDEFEFVDTLADIAKGDDIQTREKAVDQLLWDYLDEVTFFEYFTVEKILAYTIKLGLAGRWLAIDKEHGKRMFEKILSELQAGYSLPETFTDK